MVASRNRPEGGLRTPFGLGIMILLLLTGEVADQDLAALIARQPVVDRAQKAAFASTFGTIHEAKFSLPQPLGSSIPSSYGYTLAALDPDHAELTASVRERLYGETAYYASPYGGPVVDRSRKSDYGVVRTGERVVAAKGDRLKPPPQADVAQADIARADTAKPDVAKPDAAQVSGAPSSPAAVQQDQSAEQPSAAQPVEVATAPAAAQESVAEPSQATEVASGYALASAGDYRAVEITPKAAYPVLAPPREEDDADRSAEGEVAGKGDARAVAGLMLPSVDANPATRAARLYFGVGPMGQKLGAIEPWKPGEEPRFENAEIAPRNDAGTKLAALPDAWSPIDRADLPPLPSDPGVVLKDGPRGGETVAAKGQVTGESQHPMTPAERLGLDEASRVKSEKCLTEVIYFEARGEAVRGQMAVAQVVLNRVFSGKYPNTVCGVVYQNSHRHLACQFTFACDRIADVVREPDMWERAKTIASEMLDGKLWLPEVGKATHYHAYWVRPSWVREMTKMHKLGVHTFYRPRAWGDGDDAPEWGDSEATTESARRLVEAAKKL